MERFDRKSIKVTNVTDAIKAHKAGLEVVFDGVCPPEPIDIDSQLSTAKPQSEQDFTATSDIQTIPDTDHEVADRIIDWFINGGTPPLDHSIIPESLQAPKVLENGVTHFPGVISAIDELTQNNFDSQEYVIQTTPDVSRKKPLEKFKTLFVGRKRAQLTEGTAD